MKKRNNITYDTSLYGANIFSLYAKSDSNTNTTGL